MPHHMHVCAILLASSPVRRAWPSGVAGIPRDVNGMRHAALHVRRDSDSGKTHAPRTPLAQTDHDRVGTMPHGMPCCCCDIDYLGRLFGLPPWFAPKDKGFFQETKI